ncbi:MAG: hypothetical protein K6A31_04440 [Fibrobacter sp.]|nr:hypothetical protein [Fibrobacter sp.]
MPLRKIALKKAYKSAYNRQFIRPRRLQSSQKKSILGELRRQTLQKALRHSKIASELSKNTVKRAKKNQALNFSLMQALFERSMRERSPQ